MGGSFGFMGWSDCQTFVFWGWGSQMGLSENGEYLGKKNESHKNSGELICRIAFPL
jgi:hypothetical protein